MTPRGVLGRLARRADAYLFVAVPGARLWAVRAGFALLFGIRLAIGRHHDLGGQPEALFRPPLLWRWLDAMPSAEVIVAVQVVGVVAAFVALWTRRSRVPLVVAWAALAFVDGLLASRGKIMHNDVLALLAAVPVLLGPPDAAPRDALPSVRWGWPVRGATVVVVTAYACSGLAKVVSSGPAWVWSDNMANIAAAAVGTDKPFAHGVTAFLADHELVARFVALGALSLELGFLALLVRPAWGPWFAVGALGLHTGVWLVLGLDYWSWVATALLVLVDWSAVLRRPRRLGLGQQGGEPVVGGGPAPVPRASGG